MLAIVHIQIFFGAPSRSSSLTSKLPLLIRRNHFSKSYQIEHAHRKYLRANDAFPQHFSLKWNNEVRFPQILIFWNKYWHFQCKKMTVVYVSKECQLLCLKAYTHTLQISVKHASGTTNNIYLECLLKRYYRFRELPPPPPPPPPPRYGNVINGRPLRSIVVWKVKNRTRTRVKNHIFQWFRLFWVIWR